MILNQLFKTTGDVNNKCRLHHRSFVVILITLFIFGSIIDLNANSFKQVDTQTRSDIRSLQVTDDGHCFYLTNRVFIINPQKKGNPTFISERKADVFGAVSGNELWISQMLDSYISQVFHYHHGIAEEVIPPFANYITSMQFDASGEQGLFASWSEVARYHKGSFFSYPPAPTSNAIEKLCYVSPDEFYALSNRGELLHWYHGKYEHLEPEAKILDFQNVPQLGVYFLTQNALKRFFQGKISIVVQDDIFEGAKVLGIVSETEQYVAGRNGLLLSITKGKLDIVRTQNREDFTALCVFNNEVWVAGKGGKLFYKGTRLFEPFQEHENGFSSRRLISTGIPTNNEYGVAVGDVNGDRIPDLYTVCQSGPNRLYINRLESSKSKNSIWFTEEAFRRSCSGERPDDENVSVLSYKLGAAMADVDNDGDQDLYVCHLIGSNQLFLNKGNGYFRSVAYQSNRASEDLKRSNMAVFSDVDLDGDLDLFVTSEEGTNHLFANDGTGHFLDVTYKAGLTTGKGGMCAAISDINHDGLPDLAVSSWLTGDKVYLNHSENGQIRFEDISQNTAIGLGKAVKSNGIAFADVNNDGHADLFIARRNAQNSLYLNPGNGYFTDVTATYFNDQNPMLSNGVLFEDLNMDGFTDLYVSNVGKNTFFKNEQGRYFREMTATFGLEMEGYSTGLATGDFDGDHTPDVYAANFVNGNSMLLLNLIDKPCAVKFRLHGVKSNRDAIGSCIWVYESTNIHEKPVLAAYRELSAGAGYGSTSDKVLIIAIKPGLSYFARIKFPLRRDTLTISGIQPGTIVEVQEYSGVEKLATESLKAVYRYLKDREMQPEILKYLLVILCLFCYVLWQIKQHEKHFRRFYLFSAPMIFVVFMLVNQVYIFSEKPLYFYIGPLSALIFLLLTHFLMMTVINKQMIRRKQRELREKLARDLHDDLASTLGSVNIYAETLVQQSPESPNRTVYLSQKISSLSQNALNAISEIIWMTSPRNDTLQSLINKATNNMQELFSDNNIMFESEIEIDSQVIALEEHLKNNIFLILKEAVNNIVMHAETTKVFFAAVIKERQCHLTLSDYGKGFSDSMNDSKGQHGNGLGNMHRRAMDSNLDLEIISTPGKGTTLYINFKI